MLYVKQGNADKRWGNNESACRVTNRFHDPSNRYDRSGFRVVIVSE